MNNIKIHIIHVGNMSNKGTQALIKSDLFILRKIFPNNPSITVSTTDIEGVKRLGESLEGVMSPIIDIPYEKSDEYAKKMNFQRDHYKYKIFILGFFIFMPLQALMSIISVFFTKIGLKGFYKSETIKRIQKADIVISYSDENFKESSSNLPLNFYWILTWWSMLFSRTWDILISKFFRKPVVLFPNSIGPFRTWFGVCLGKLALNLCDFLLIREPISFNIAKSLKIKTPKKLTSDTAILFPHGKQVNLNDLPRPLISVSPGFYTNSLSEKDVERYIISHASALDNIIDKYNFSCIFLPHYITGFKNDDLEVSEIIFNKMKNKKNAKVIKLDSVGEFKTYLENSDIVISSKMHPAVLSTSSHIPTVCIAYDQKQIGFFNSLGLEKCLIVVQEISPDLLYEKIDYVWNHLEEIKLVLIKKMSSLKNEVEESIKFSLNHVLS